MSLVQLVHVLISLQINIMQSQVPHALGLEVASSACANRSTKFAWVTLEQLCRMLSCYAKLNCGQVDSSQTPVTSHNLESYAFDAF